MVAKLQHKYMYMTSREDKASRLHLSIECRELGRACAPQMQQGVSNVLACVEDARLA